MHECEAIAPDERGGLQGTETIHLCEDDDSIRQVTELFLEGTGYDVLSAGSGSAALALSAQREGRIDLLVTEVIMPDMNGRELATRLTCKRPEMKTPVRRSRTQVRSSPATKPQHRKQPTPPAGPAASRSALSPEGPLRPAQVGSMTASSLQNADKSRRNSLYISGYSADATAHHGVLIEGIERLEKPFSRVALLRRVRAVLCRRS
ncbi:MAG: response regulator [Planctomycetota bacterium]